MENLKVGHFSHQENGTGISVFLFEQAAVGAYVLSGSGPASHELAPLDPETSVAYLHALVLSGGSAYGLFAAHGVMRYLTEHEIGLKLPHGVVPIVPAVAIYDLGYKKAIPPNEADAYQACLNAVENNTASGQIGAGTGASVGKTVPNAKRMTGGIGYAELSLPNGVKVCAYVVVNSVGDVIDQQGNIVAGAKLQNGEFADCTKFILSGAEDPLFFKPSNTTLAAVFTNAKFTKSELKRVSKMAIAGMARAISPVFTCFDGDILFSISVGDKKASVLTVGTMGAEVVRLAILDAVKNAEVI